MNARTSLSSWRSRSSSRSSKPRKSEKGESSRSRSSRSLTLVTLVRPLLIEALLVQERLGDRGQVVALAETRQVSSVVEVQPRARDQRCLHPRVDRRDDRIVVAAHHQRRLPDQAEERQAAPAGHRSQLEGVAPLWARTGGGGAQVGAR